VSVRSLPHSNVHEVCVRVQADISNRAVITPDDVMRVTTNDTVSESRSITRGSWHKMAALTMLAAFTVEQTQEPALRMPLQISATICTRRVIQSALPPIGTDTLVFGCTKNNEYKTDSEFATLTTNVARKLNLKTRSIMGQDVLPNVVGHRGRDGILYELLCNQVVSRAP